MLSYTTLPSGSILFSCFGNFLSPDETHLILVKPHCIDYYLTNQIYNNSEPDLELTFESTIISAYNFTLPSHKCSTIALLSEDLTLIILSAPFSQEQNSEEEDQESPIERTICDQIRIAHVIPSPFSPLFASSENHLFISVYPNSLCVIAFNQNKSSFVLEKNEIHFLKYLPSFLYGESAKQKLISLDTRDNTIKSLDLTKMKEAIEQQSYDSSSLLFSESIQLDQKIDYFYIANGHLFLMTKEKIIIQDQSQSFDLSNHSGISTVNLNQQKSGLYISFKDGDFSFFDFNTNTLSLLKKLKPYTIITPIENDKILLASPTEKAMIFDSNLKSVALLFPNQISNSLSMTTINHTIPNQKQIIMTDNRFLHSIGLGIHLNPTTIVKLNGERLFVFEKNALVSTHDKTIIIDSESGSDISQSCSFETQQSTLFFTQYDSDWFIQFCPHKIVAFNKNTKATIKFDIEIQHAITSNKTIIVASNSLNFIQFDGTHFQTIRSIEFNDEISSISVHKEKFLILSTWRNLTVFVYDIESGNKLSEFKSTSSEAKYVVRSICEISDHLFFGTSRGNIICTKIDGTTGNITELSQKHLSASTIMLSKVSFENREYLCASSDRTYLIRLSADQEIEILPTNIGNTISISQTSDKSIVTVLTDSLLTFGQFEQVQIHINQRELESTIQKVIAIDSTTIVALLATKLIVIDSLLFDIVKEIQLDANFNYTNMSFFSMNEDKYIVLCAGKQAIEENQFSENGSILFVKNFDEISTAINTNGLPTAAVFSLNSLFVCSGPFVYKYSVSKEVVCSLVKESPGLMLASDLLVTDNKIIIIDAFKSVSIFDLDLQRTSTDFFTKYLVAGCDASHSLLVSDSHGCVYLLQSNDNRIVTKSQMNVGETVTAISKWTHINEVNCDIYIGVTSKGSIQAFVTGIDQALFESMEKLQNEMEAYFAENGELSHFNYRAIYSPAYREPYQNYVDANFLMGFQELEEDSQNLMLQKRDIKNADSIFKLINLLDGLTVQ